MNITTEQLEGMLSAQYVQNGLLPKRRHFERIFKDSFVLYQPQNLVSGDFYWVGQKNDNQYLVVGDCTGHGISASLTSVLALNLLEYGIMNKGIKRPSKILYEVDKRYVESFKGANDEKFDNPWIDLAIVCVNKETKTLYFSGANRKMLVVKANGESKVYRSKGTPIGSWQIYSAPSFDTVTVPYETGDCVFLGSDGYQDQFGGPKNKKFGSRKLHELLIQNAGLQLKEQRKALKQALESWKQDAVQTDDICIVGVRL